MRHEDIIAELKNNQSDLRKNANEALINIATRKDLSPAQLQRMAQVYNAWHSVSHFKNASDRASTPPGLVDPPQLVERYLQTGEKSASQATSPAPVAQFHGRNFAQLLLNDNQQQKVAAAIEVPKTQEVEYSLDQVKEAASVMIGEATFEAHDICRQLLKVATDLYEPVHDARYQIGDASALRAAEFVREFADTCKVATTIPAATDLAPLRPRSLQIETGASRLLVKLASTLDDLAFARDTLQLVQKKAGTKKEEEMTPEEEIVSENARMLAESGLTAEQMRAHNISEEMISRAFGAVGVATGKTPEKLDPTTAAAVEAARAQVVQEAAAAEEEKEKNSGPGGYEEDEEGGGKGGKGGGGGKGGHSATGENPLISAVTGLAGVVSAPFSMASSGIQAGATKASDMLNAVASAERKNTAQMQSDMNVDDIKRQIRFMRMIQNDPILREHDKSKLTAVYNSLAEANPRLASDMESLRLIMREAAAHEGVTIDTIKQLADIRKSTADAAQREKELTDRKYTTSDKGLSNLIKV